MLFRIYQDAAAKYANQHGVDRPGDELVQRTQYFIAFGKADNRVAELLVAGYQKFLEGDFWGLTTATQENKNMMNLYGRSGLHLDGHSRGSMTVGNAMESLLNDFNSAGQLGRTTANFFGPAENVAHANTVLGILQNREGMTKTNDYNDSLLHYQNHKSDPIGGLIFIGNNPSTGGTNRPEKNWMSEARNAMGGEYTVHNCYGKFSKSCSIFWTDSEIRRPSFIPAEPYK